MAVITAGMICAALYCFGEENGGTDVNTLSIGIPSKITGEINIPLNRPEELDFMTKEDIYSMREQRVMEYPGLLSGGYRPRDAVFGQILSGKPWGGILGVFHYGQGENSIAGPSEESRFILNPFLLAGLAEKYVHRSVNTKGKPEANYPVPESLIWKPREREAGVTYDISGYWKKNMPLFGLKASDLRSFLISAYNARDFGFRYIYIVPGESYNITPRRISGSAVMISQFLHCGGSSGYPGGCNNMSPLIPELDVTVSGLPARIYLKLWENQPANVKDDPDMIFVIELK
ncbi:MAG: hypothetical protein JXJ19_08565 [Elusimicrobia bacterium]|nr:hypothetical protein [Elusimicrobiota bacterium]